MWQIYIKTNILWKLVMGRLGTTAIRLVLGIHGKE